jgi:hypothetical protein
MTETTLLTAAELCAFLDQHPDVEARAILARDLSAAHYILEPYEVAVCRGVLRGDPVARAEFPAVRDRIMARWSASTRPTDEAHTDTSQRGDEGTSVGPAGACASALALSSFRPAGEGSNLPAGPEKITTEWTLTIRRPR